MERLRTGLDKFFGLLMLAAANKSAAAGDAANILKTKSTESLRDAIGMADFYGELVFSNTNSKPSVELQTKSNTSFLLSQVSCLGTPYLLQARKPVIKLRDLTSERNFSFAAKANDPQGAYIPVRSGYGPGFIPQVGNVSVLTEGREYAYFCPGQTRFEISSSLMVGSINSARLQILLTGWQVEWARLDL